MIKKLLFFCLSMNCLCFFFLNAQQDLPIEQSTATKNNHEQKDSANHSIDPFHDYYHEHPMQDNHVRESDNFQAKFLNMLFILTLLIGFMILASWLLKKMMKARITQINQASYIKILETRQLSTKSTLYFVEIDDERVLIGESAAGLHSLAHFAARVEVPLANENN